MATRKSVKRFETESVQGEGSFVILSSPKVEQILEWQEKAAALKPEGKAKGLSDAEAIKIGMEMLAEHIIDWDWVDDHGQPLPVPNGDVDVIAQLTMEETNLLSDLLTDAGSKNSVSGSATPSGAAATRQEK